MFGPSPGAFGPPPSPSRTFDPPLNVPEPTPFVRGVDAGREPSHADTDGDGCLDVAEELLGGCDGDKDAVVVVSCLHEYLGGNVTFDVPATEGGLFSEVQLVVSSEVGFVRVKALDVFPEGAAVVGEASFTGVVGGSRLHFRLYYEGESRRALSLTSLFLITDAGDVLDQGRLLLVTEAECPTPI
jgi:hypothetical protein